MAKRFVTIVPHIENLELRKDTGQLPYYFYKALGYESTLVTYFYSIEKGRKGGPFITPPTVLSEIEHHYPYLKTEVPGLNLSFLKYKGRGKFYEIAILDYLKKEAKNITVLNLFHFSSENIFYSLVYKFLNPGGKLYIKLDLDISFYESNKSFFNTSGKLGFIKKVGYKILLLPLFFKSVNLFSAESKKGTEYFKRRFRIKDEKIKTVVNGIPLKKGLDFDLEKKENIILTVGRLGTSQKNTQLILNAITGIDLKDWKVILAGPIEKEFQPVINSFFEKNSHLKEKVFFTGNISDSETLYQYYQKSKVFLLSSTWESFGLVVAEALHFGCFPILSSEIMPIEEFTNNGEYGLRFSPTNVNELKKAVEKAVNNELDIVNISPYIAKYAQSVFNWDILVKKIENHLFNK